MKKLLSLSLSLLLLVLFVVPSAIASVGVQEDATVKGQVADLDFTTGINVTKSGTKAIVALDQTMDVTFNTTLLATGRIGASSTIASSANGINPSTLPYSVLTKSIGNVAGETATLGIGAKNGQILVIRILHAGTSGTWIVTLSQSTTISTLTFDAAGDRVTLLWDSTQGWILLSHESVTVAEKNITG